MKLHPCNVAVTLPVNHEITNITNRLRSWNVLGNLTTLKGCTDDVVSW